MEEKEREGRNRIGKPDRMSLKYIQARLEVYKNDLKLWENVIPIHFTVSEAQHMN